MQKKENVNLQKQLNDKVNEVERLKKVIIDLKQKLEKEKGKVRQISKKRIH